MVSITGLFVRDPAIRGQLVWFIVDQLPPLAPVLTQALDEALAIAPTTSVVGLVILVWSASALVRALDTSIALVFAQELGGRSPLRAVFEVLVVAAGMIGLALAVVLGSIPGPISDLLGIGEAGRLAVALAMAALCGVVYRFLPLPRPSWHAVLVPATWIGIAVTLLTGAFTFLGPHLIGTASLAGAFAGLFLGLLWLSYVTQLLLVGAAWVQVRQQAVPPAGGAARPD